MTGRPVRAGQVYQHPSDSRRFMVVMTGSAYNMTTRRPIVCPLVLTEEIIKPVAAEALHTITPSPGYLAYPLRYNLLASELVTFVGEVEHRPLQRAQRAAIDGYIID